VWCDSFTKENDVWVVVLFEGFLIDSRTVVDSNLYMEGSVEIQREKTGVDENTFLAKRGC
jgi:hypothetical protein